MGHRLTLQIARWTAEVSLTNSQPTSAVLRADLTSLEVLDAEGGVTPLTPVDRSVIKRNAAKSMKSQEHPDAVFSCVKVGVGDSLEATSGDMTLSGSLAIAQKSTPFDVTLHARLVDGVWKLNTTCIVRQSDFGIKPYSLMVGAVRVGDEVSIDFSASFAAEKLV